MRITELFAELKRRWDAETPAIHKKIVSLGSTLGIFGLAFEAWPNLANMSDVFQQTVHYMTAIGIVAAAWAQLQEKK